jgi:D-methionine transport system substrate-binding protein
MNKLSIIAKLAKKWIRSPFVLVLVIGLSLSVGLTSCGEDAVKGSEANPVRIGVVGESDSQWPALKLAAKEAGIYVDIIGFTEYTQPNPALDEGQLDINEFQHILYLAKYNADNNKSLLPFAATAVYPISLYGDPLKGVTKIDDLKNGDKVAIPADGTNQSRAIFLLESAGLVTLKSKSVAIATPADIDEANSKVEIFPVTADLTATTLSDPQIKGTVVNNDFVVNLTEDARKNALITESAESEGAKPYINVFVAKASEQNNELYNKIADIFNTDSRVQNALSENAGGSDKLVRIGNSVSKATLQEILQSQQKIYLESKSDKK